MLAPSRVCKSRKHSKTFTGCWTCRARKVKCDETRPACLQCREKRLDCAGYGVRLHWLPPEHGVSNLHRDPPGLPQSRPQRSQIPFELRHFGLRERDLERILGTIDDVAVHWDCSVPSNRDPLVLDGFGVFEASLPCNTPYSVATDPIDPVSSNPIFEFNSSPLADSLGCISDATHSEPICPFSPVGFDNADSFVLPDEYQLIIQDIFSSHNLTDPPNQYEDSHPIPHEPNDNEPQQKDVLRVNGRHLSWVEPGGANIRSPCPSYLSPLEQFLMHHYMHRAVRLFCIIENRKSPWHKIHLPRALQGTGQMSVEGSTSQIQDALRNALLSISAFVLSNDNKSRGREDEAVRWVNEAMVLRGKTIKLLKDSVERGLGSGSPTKYKDCLATMLSMISINVMSGDTGTCGVHLDGALHFMKMARLWKARYSPKARSLHRTYNYLRTIYESTALKRKEPLPHTSTNLNIPELLHPSAAANVCCRSEQGSSKGYCPLDTESRMSTYEFIYGVPQSLLMFLHKATDLIISVIEAREKSGNTMVPEELSDQCDELENAIMDWPIDSELNKCLLGDSSTSSEIIRKTAQAFHNAVIIYFAQHIRLVGHRYLRPYIQTVLECIESIEKIKADSHCLAAPLYWPAFIAASEAFDERLQERFKAWYEQVEVYGIAAVRTGISVLIQVWKDGAVTGNRMTSRWHMEVKRTGSMLMLS